MISQAIFLSYASQDADVARGICDALRAVGLEVWFDQSELRGGDAGDQSIRKQIKECALFVPIISANTQERSEGYFRLEWKLAVDRSHLMADDQAFFVPVIIDDTPEASARVPEKFRERQWTRLNDDMAMASFVQRIAKLLARGDSPAINAPKDAPALGVGTSEVAPKVDDTPSIAVLAFTNRSASADDEYFSDGLADELLNVLAKIKGLRVAARTSAFSFKGKQTTVAEIGRVLNVATVLEGSVRKSGNRARIAVQLVKVTDGFQLWSETYDRTLDDIFAVQDEIAQSVVKEVRGAVAGTTPYAAMFDVQQEVALAAKGRSASVEAHSLYLQGRYLVMRRSRGDLERGTACLRQALVEDAGNAPSWAWLSRALGFAADLGIIDVEEGIAETRAAAERALSLAPDLAEAHIALSSLQARYQFDWTGAESSLQRAFAIEPQNSEALSFAGLLAFAHGRLATAITFFQLAITADPVATMPYTRIGRVYLSLGKLADAEIVFRRALEISPEALTAKSWLALVLLAQGRLEEALAEAKDEPAEYARLCGMAIVHHAVGHVRESDLALHDLIDRRAHDAAYQIAIVHAARDAHDQAFNWLERAYEQRDSGIWLLKPEPQFKSLHGDPRWNAFLQKMHLAQ